MTITLFEQFKDVLAVAVQDTDFVRKNTIFQDSTYLQTVLDRIEALTDDVSFLQDYTDIDSTLGLLAQNTAERKITFDPKGFETTLSIYREGVTGEPRRLFKRPTVADSIYYLLADGGIGSTGTGVLLLNDQLEVIQRFPHYGTNIASGDYEDSSAAITFTLNSIEYVAIADATHHVVQIYLYASPYTKQATIGTIDTPGADTDLLTAPNGIAVDETNSLMYISCPTGQPTGATASNGFVAVYDISTIGTPVFDSIPLYYSGTGALIDSQVYTPVDLLFDNSLLWVSNNGDNTVGAFDMSGASPLPLRYIEAAGPGYILRGPQQVSIRTLTGGFRRLYIANGDTGTVEEFDANTFVHLQTYGIRASEDNLNTYTRLSPDVYGALALPHGVVADTMVIDDQETNVMVVTDPTNGRLQRFNLDAYTEDNFVNFEMITWDVPVIVDGWNVSGNVPLDMIKVYYRLAMTEQFRELPQETSLPASRTVQFRLGVQLDTRKFVHSDWYIHHLRVHGRQA